MRISAHRKKTVEKLSQEEYIKKVLRLFNIVDAKPINVPLRGHFKLLKAHELKTKDEKALLSKVSYALAMGSLMYTIVCMRSYIAQAVRIVSRYMSNPGQEQWRAVK